jgi:chromosome segregation ATPase
MIRLLDYYRMKVEMIEKERFDWLAKLEEVNMKSEEFHEKELDLQKLTEQITELQQSLSESNIALNQERKKVIHFSNEIDSHKLKTKDDRRRMMQLLQLAEPVENSMKIYFDRRPELADKPQKKRYKYIYKKKYK